jgi:hypothetical protein
MGQFLKLYYLKQSAFFPAACDGCSEAASAESSTSQAAARTDNFLSRGPRD